MGQPRILPPLMISDISFFYPCLDRMIQELTHRFSDVGEELMSGIPTCSPNSSTFLSEDAHKCLALHYKIQLKPEELFVAKNMSL